MFADWYDRTITVHIPGDTDEWGAQLPGSDVEVPCRISEQITLTRNSDGEETTSSTTVYADLAHAATFGTDYEVEFDSPAGHRTAQIISVSVNVGDEDLEGVTVRLT